MNLRRLCMVVAALFVVAGLMMVLEMPEGPRMARDPELLTILGDVSVDAVDLQGRWVTASPDARSKENTMRALESLPYTQGSTAAPEASLVTAHIAGLAYPGLNFFTSGHGPEAFVIDMRGRPLHRWRLDIAEVWPDVPQTIHGTFWRRALPLPDGDVLAVFEGIGLVRVDRRSKVRWAIREGCHHEVVQAPDGTFFVLTRRAEVVPALHPDEYVLLDAITHIDAQGQVLDSWDILECLQKSSFGGLVEAGNTVGDFLHTNSLALLDGSQAALSPHYQQGNFLISIRQLDLVAILDPRQRKIVWGSHGGGKRLLRQHDPTLLSGGGILVFDNLGADMKSRVFAFDAGTKEVLWEYNGTADAPLFSKTCGTAQRLPNGNTLITESDMGRALEVTPDGRIAWDFYNPNRAGEHNELIATLFEMIRLDADFFPWLSQDTASAEPEG